MSTRGATPSRLTFLEALPCRPKLSVAVTVMTFAPSARPTVHVNPLPFRVAVTVEAAWHSTLLVGSPARSEPVTVTGEALRAAPSAGDAMETLGGCDWVLKPPLALAA